MATPPHPPRAERLQSLVRNYISFGTFNHRYTTIDYGLIME